MISPRAIVGQLQQSLGAASRIGNAAPMIDFARRCSPNSRRASGAPRSLKISAARLIRPGASGALCRSDPRLYGFDIFAYHRIPSVRN